MSSSLKQARNRLMNEMGEYGRIHFEWLRQKYNLGLDDEVPEAMMAEVNSIGRARR